MLSELYNANFQVKVTKDRAMLRLAFKNKPLILNRFLKSAFEKGVDSELEKIAQEL